MCLGTKYRLQVEYRNIKKLVENHCVIVGNIVSKRKIGF